MYFMYFLIKCLAWACIMINRMSVWRSPDIMCLTVKYFMIKETWYISCICALRCAILELFLLIIPYSQILGSLHKKIFCEKKFHDWWGLQIHLLRFSPVQAECVCVQLYNFRSLPAQERILEGESAGLEDTNLENLLKEYLNFMHGT